MPTMHRYRYRCLLRITRFHITRIRYAASTIARIA